jgi:hypothetical protein
MPHLPPAHHETNKRDSPNKTKIKEKQNKTIPDSNLNFAKSMTHHNQTKELILVSHSSINPAPIHVPLTTSLHEVAEDSR